MKRKILIAFAVISITSVCAFAIVNRHHSEHHGHHHFKGEKGKAFHKKMMAIVIEKRKEFEKQLTEDEKSTIAEIRAKFPKKGHFKHGDHMKGKHHKERTEEERAAHREKIKPLLAIAENHKDELDAIRKAVHEEMDFDRHKEEREISEERMQKMHKRMTIRFLLMDPNKVPIEKESKSIPFKVYPNPAKNQTTIAYTLRETETVRIDILDENGNHLKSVLNEEKSSGAHEKNIDLSDLESGKMYFISIHSNSGSQTLKLQKINE